MKAFALWLQGVWDQLIIGARMALGDTRPKEIREAPIGYMGQNKAPNHHGRVNTIVLGNTCHAFSPEMAATPLRDTRKPVLDRDDTNAKSFFLDLVVLGLFNHRCNLNGFTQLWGFQVVYDKQELRMFRCPVVNSSPTVILTAEGMSRRADADLSTETIYELLHELREHVAKQNLTNKEKQ